MLRVLLLIDDYNELLYLQTVLKKIGFDVEGLNSQKKYSDASLGFNPQILVASAKGKKVDALSLGQTIRRHRGFPKIIALKRPGVSLSDDEMEASGIDLAVDSPVNIKKLVEKLADLGNVDQESFMKKLDKLNSSGEEEVSASDLEEISSLDGLDNHYADIKAQKEVEDIAGIDNSVQIVTGDVSEDNDPQHITGDATVKGSPFPEKTSEEYQVSDEDKGTRAKRFENYLATMEKPEQKQFERDRILEFNKKIRERGSTDDIEQVEDERKKFVKALFTQDDNS